MVEIRIRESQLYFNLHIIFDIQIPSFFDIWGSNSHSAVFVMLSFEHPTEK